MESVPWNFDWYNLSLFDYYDKIYRQLSDHRFGGFFSRFSPKLMIRDPELIKRVLVKDFEYFHDRGDVIFDENEPITMHMFSAPGYFWRSWYFMSDSIYDVIFCLLCCCSGVDCDSKLASKRVKCGKNLLAEFHIINTYEEWFQ